MRLIKVSLATFTFNKVAASVLCVCVCCIFGGSLTSLPSPPTRLSLFLQAHLRQRGPPHLREHGRAEGRHPGPDPGRQAQGSCGGGAGEGLSRAALWLLEPPPPLLPLCDSVVSLPFCSASSVHRGRVRRRQQSFGQRLLVPAVVCGPSGEKLTRPEPP